MNIVFIGAGNLATSLATEMHRKGLPIKQIYSRTAESASLLAEKLDCRWTTSIDEVDSNADWYIFSVKDNVLEQLIAEMKPNNGLWLHTAGSMPATVFKGFAMRYGVIYPLQTFNKNRALDFGHIPFILEANNQEDLEALKKASSLLTDNVRFLDSEERRQIHLAAVFANNFSNHMWHLAWQLLEDKGISPDILLPLIKETAAKVEDLPPAQAQTGPAMRYDRNVIDKHIDMLENEDLKTIYRLISQSIHKTKSKS